jgi:hypothetical protein
MVSAIESAQGREFEIEGVGAQNLLASPNAIGPRKFVSHFHRAYQVLRRGTPVGFQGSRRSGSLPMFIDMG